jgi:hypothetical protein
MRLVLAELTPRRMSRAHPHARINQRRRQC